MKEQLLAEIVAIAKQMNSLPKSSEATVSYDLLADGLWWSDERIPHSGSSDSLRVLLRYRTSLIIGEPEDRYLTFWSAAKQAFPNWPGFDPERCGADEGLATIYHKSKKIGMLSLDLMDIVCRLEKAFNGKVPAKIIEKHAYRNDPPDIAVGELYDLTCRCIRMSGSETPPDAWERLRDCVAASLGIDTDSIFRESRLVSDLGAG